ncbi:hypothetical protein [Herbidospora mongoliensis]|nr:hypothetical protein [Herbidospora mongoliensis]
MRQLDHGSRYVSWDQIGDHDDPIRLTEPRDALMTLSELLRNARG